MPRIGLPVGDKLVLLFGTSFLLLSNALLVATGFTASSAYGVLLALDFLGVYALLFEAYHLTRTGFIKHPYVVAAFQGIVALVLLLIVLSVPYPRHYPYPAAPEFWYNSGGDWVFSGDGVYLWYFIVPAVFAGLAIISLTGIVCVLQEWVDELKRAGLFVIIVPVVATLLIVSQAPNGPFMLEYLFLLMLSPVLVLCAVAEIASTTWKEMELSFRVGATLFALACSVPFTLLMTYLPSLGPRAFT